MQNNYAFCKDAILSIHFPEYLLNPTLSNVVCSGLHRKLCEFKQNINCKFIQLREINDKNYCAKVL